MARIEGFKELNRQLGNMSKAARGKALRSAAFRSTLPTVKRAKQLIPVGNPPYESWGGKDPYPVKTYKGRLRTPGFAKRNIARKSKLTENGVIVMVGVKPEAFYAINFIEFGIPGKIPKHPWLEPAFRSSLPELNRILKERLKELIKAATRI
jgi:HK97 gp10 family phage protein